MTVRDLCEKHGYVILSMPDPDREVRGAYVGDLLITEGDASVLEAGEMWYGPLLGPIPLDVKGKMNDEKLYVGIDITLVLDEDQKQIIHVDFGEDDFTSGINLTPAPSKGEGVSVAYDLQGRPVVLSPAQKGLFIVNGKKVLIK